VGLKDIAVHKSPSRKQSQTVAPLPDKRAYRRSGVLELSSHRCTKSNALIRLISGIFRLEFSILCGHRTDHPLIRQRRIPFLLRRKLHHTPHRSSAAKKLNRFNAIQSRRITAT